MRSRLIFMCSFGLAGLFVAGLLFRVFHTLVLVRHVDATHTVWFEELSLAIGTIIPVHGLGYMLSKYRDYLYSREVGRINFVRWLGYSILWSTLSTYVYCLLLHRPLAGLAGWGVLAVAGAAVFVLLGYVFSRLVPGVRDRERPLMLG